MRRLLVLVAEDNEDHLFLTTLALQSADTVDVEVVGVRDGVQAIDYLSEALQPAADNGVPDLVLLDLSMPRRNGLQVLAHMREDERMSRIPVVVLTSSDQPDDIRNSYDLGANCFVTKSGDLSDLVDFWTKTAKLPPH